MDRVGEAGGDEEGAGGEGGGDAGGGEAAEVGRRRRRHRATFGGTAWRTMNAEIETYSKYIRKQIADVHAALKG